MNYATILEGLVGSHSEFSPFEDTLATGNIDLTGTSLTVKLP